MRKFFEPLKKVLLLALTGNGPANALRAATHAHAHTCKRVGLEQEMNVWGGCDLLQILLATAAEQRGGVGSELPGAAAGPHVTGIYRGEARWGYTTVRLRCASQ